MINWIIQAPTQTEQVPIGSYQARFVSVGNFKLKGEDRLKWVWEVVNGEHTGHKATALTSLSLKDSVHAGRLLSGLLNRQLIVGENVENAINACKGKMYMVSVQRGPQGGKPSVQYVSSLPEM